MKVYEPFEEIFDDEEVCRSFHKAQDGWEQLTKDNMYMQEVDAMINKFFNKTGE